MERGNLVLTRKEKETVKIGDDVTITLNWASKGIASISVAAPKSLRIIRGELDHRPPKEAA